jgi:tetratricopeptide (TPR) repeat protein
MGKAAHKKADGLWPMAHGQGPAKVRGRRYAMGAFAAVSAMIVMSSLLALGQEPGATPPKSHQGPWSGVTVRKMPAEKSPQDIAAGEVSQAETALDKKDFAGAETLLKKAAAHDPKSYRAWFDLGVLYSQSGRATDAIDAYRKAVALNPKLFEANFNLGVLLAQSGNAEAESYLRAATQLTPSLGRKEEAQAAAWQALGLLLKSSKPKEAIAAFQHEAQLKPNDATVHVQAGEVAEKIGDTATAEKEYAAAQQIDPRNTAAAAGTANLLMQGGQLEEAEAAIRKYIAMLQPASNAADLAKAHQQLGRVLLQLHRRPEAIAEFEEAAKLSPATGKGMGELAWLYLQDKQYDKAESGFRQLLQATPNDAELHMGLGEALIPQKKFAEAQQQLISAVQLKPTLADAYSDLAFAASENQNYMLTIQALDARIKLNRKETAGTMFLRATALDHLGDKQNAAASYREFLTLAEGKFPDQEWQARHRLIAIQPNKK